MRVDVAGQRFGNLVALEPVIEGSARWNCQCDCGKRLIRYAYRLLGGIDKSCGCTRRDAMVKRGRDSAKHGASNTPTYRSWRAMKDRCTNQNSTYYHLYGGRGITVCDRWLNSFGTFASDMGTRPPGKTLDRIDTNGNYEPGNCRWATLKEQARNRRDTVIDEIDASQIRWLITDGGCGQTQVARAFGIPSCIVHSIAKGHTWQPDGMA